MLRIGFSTAWVALLAACVTGSVLRLIADGSTANPDPAHLRSYSRLVESHVYLGFAILAGPWPVLLFPQAPRKPLLWAGLGLWAVTTLALAAGYGSREAWQFYSPYSTAPPAPYYTDTLLLAMATGSALTMAAGVRRLTLELLVAALHIMLLAAFAVGVVEGMADDLLSSWRPPPSLLTDPWTPLWGLPVTAAAGVLTRRWWHSSPASGAAALLALVTALGSAGALVSVQQWAAADIHIHDTLLLSVLTHHGIYGWPLLSLLAAWTLRRTAQNWMAFTAVGILGFGVLVELGACAWLGELGMPRRYATWLNTYDWPQTVAGLGGWTALTGAAVCGLLARLRPSPPQIGKVAESV